MESLLSVKSSNTLSYIVKVTGDCNLSCNYCYFFDTVKKKPRSRLDLKLVEKFLIEASEISSCVDIIWHGGEPLIPNISYYQEIFAIQDDISNSRGGQFKNKLQTNATLINPKWAYFLNQHKIGVGVSLDGPEWIHDTNRITTSGKGSFDKAIKGIRLLQESEINFSVLAVVTKKSIQHFNELFSFFIDNKIKKIDFLPYVEMTEHDGLYIDSLEQGDYAEFMMHIFDLWLEQNDPSIVIRSLEEMVVGVLGGKPSLCSYNQGCSDFITINYDGTVSACDNLLGNEDFIFGDLRADSLGKILVGGKVKNFKKKLDMKLDICLGCNLLKLCNGGCTKYNYLSSNGFVRDRKSVV